MVGRGSRIALEVSRRNALGDRNGAAGLTGAPSRGHALDHGSARSQTQQLCAERVIRALAKVLNRAGASPYLSGKFRATAECSRDGEIIRALEAKPGR